MATLRTPAERSLGAVQFPGTGRHTQACRPARTDRRGQERTVAQGQGQTGAPGAPAWATVHSSSSSSYSTSTAHRLWVGAQRALLALAVILFLFLGVLPRLGLYRPVTVLSGSMRPTFSPGDMVIVTPEPVSAVRVGQVISYQVPVGIHQVETHRIVRILSGGAHPVVQTQGDANNYHDPWTARLEGKTAWRMVAVVPHLGYVVNFLRGPALRTTAIIVVPALLALLVLLDMWGLTGAGSAGEAEAHGQAIEGAQAEASGVDRRRAERDRRADRGGWAGSERRAGRERRIGWRAGWTSPASDLRVGWQAGVGTEVVVQAGLQAEGGV